MRKNSKYSSSDKVSVRTISGVSTADMDWRTSFKDGTSEVASQVEARNNSGSTMVDNDSADRASGERVGSTYSDFSAARSNVVVSPSDMMLNGGSMNQETIL